MQSFAYKQFRKTVPMGAASPVELLARLFISAARDVAALKTAMETGNLEERVALTQKLMDLFSQLGSYLNNGPTPEEQQAYQALKTYCDGTYVLLSRLNLKTDVQTAAALESSLRTSAKILRDMIARTIEAEEKAHGAPSPRDNTAMSPLGTPTTFSA